MFNLEAEVEGWRRSMKRRGLTPEIVEELESHLIESFEYRSMEMPPERAFIVAKETVGNPTVIGSEFEKVSVLISIANNMKNLVLGSVIAVFSLYVFTLMIGIDPILFFQPPELLGVVFVPIGFTITSFGFPRVVNAVRCVFGRADPSVPSVNVLKRWITATYATGGLVFVMGLTVGFANFEEEVRFGGIISASFTSLIYSIVIAELFLRSALSKLREFAVFCGSDEAPSR